MQSTGALCSAAAARLLGRSFAATAAGPAVRVRHYGACAAARSLVGHAAAGKHVPRGTTTAAATADTGHRAAHGASGASVEATRLVYDAHGNPTEVLRLETHTLRATPTGSEVLVGVLAAPINPADINQVQGVYPKLPASLPAVGGNEGVGEVLAVGPGVSMLAVGDRVLPAASGWGTWQTHRMADEEELVKVPSDISVLAAATLAVNPCTAYRMLRDFVALEPGDCVIQNGGNSGVGRAVVQIAASLGVATVSVIRDRPNLAEEVDGLAALGATRVVTEEELKAARGRDLLGGLPRPKLALNCVGGSSSLLLSKPLAPGGTVVTYGGMSKRPVMIPTGKLIFDDAVYRGFWMTRWNEQAPRAERERMLADVAALVREGKLRLPCRSWSLADAADALKAAMQERTGVKEVLVMSPGAA